jgi:hypothetical protein
MLAEESVSFVNADGAGVWADRVTLAKNPAGREVLRVEGQPAKIGDARGMLLARSIDFDPASGDAKATGGGKFETAMAAAGDKTTIPATVSWTGDLNFSATAGTAEVNDGVTIESNQSDGTTVAGSAKSLALIFEKTTTDQPAASPLSGRRIRDVNLLGDVQFAAARSDDNGALLQRMNLFSDKLVYQPVDGQIVVPVGGRMLVEDRRADESPKSEGEVAAPRGATAFQWSEKLSYAPGDSRAEMTGDVNVVFQPADNSPPLRLFADVVQADLLANGANSGAPQVKRVSARGNVRFNGPQLEFSAAETEFRPQENIVIARGDDTEPATLLDETGLSKGTFAELWLNTKTQESHLRDFRAMVRR